MILPCDSPQKNEGIHNQHFFLKRRQTLSDSQCWFVAARIQTVCTLPLVMSCDALRFCLVYLWAARETEYTKFQLFMFAGLSDKFSAFSWFLCIWHCLSVHKIWDPLIWHCLFWLLVIYPLIDPYLIFCKRIHLTSF